MEGPILTIAISTYNRVERLQKSLKQIQKEIASLDFPSQVELIVVDNASTDGTSNFLQDEAFSNLTVIRNSTNQGMLGNLNICALRSRGKYVWCLGDDDFLIPGALDRVLSYARIGNNPIIYLNYAHATIDDKKDQPLWNVLPTRLQKSGEFTLAEAIQANSNLMTAIYAMVLRRDQAIVCYSVSCTGKPFLSLNACVPTTVYALSLNPVTKVFWIAEPTVAVDLRVSWIKYAPVWILERFPEMILEFVEWGNGRVNLEYLVDEMRPGISHWLAQYNSPDFEKPSDFKFLKAVLNLYGHSSNARVITRLTDIEGSGNAIKN